MNQKEWLVWNHMLNRALECMFDYSEYPDIQNKLNDCLQTIQDLTDECLQTIQDLLTKIDEEGTKNGC